MNTDEHGYFFRVFFFRAFRAFRGSHLLIHHLPLILLILLILLVLLVLLVPWLKFATTEQEE